MKKLIAAIASVMFAAALVSAKDDESGKNELSVWRGYAPAVRTFDLDGRTWDGKLGIGALRYSRRFNNSGWVALKQPLESSVVVLNYPDKIVTPTSLLIAVESRSGFRVAPIGLQGNFRPWK